MADEGAPLDERVSAEELVSVRGMRLPRSEWEGEVMVAAAGRVAMVHGTMVMLLPLVVLVGGDRLEGFESLVCCVGAPCLIGILEFAAGGGLLKRDRSSRVLLVALSLGWLLVVGGLGVVGWLVGTSPRREVNASALVVLTATYIPALFTLYALMGRSGQRVFAMKNGLQPISPLGSVQTVGGSAQAWAAFTVVWLTALLCGTFLAVLVVTMLNR